MNLQVNLQQRMNQMMTTFIILSYLVLVIESKYTGPTIISSTPDKLLSSTLVQVILTLNTTMVTRKISKYKTRPAGTPIKYLKNPTSRMA